MLILRAIVDVVDILIVGREMLGGNRDVSGIADVGFYSVSINQTDSRNDVARLRCSDLMISGSRNFNVLIPRSRN